jgi:hypothetical protein
VKLKVPAEIISFGVIQEVVIERLDETDDCGEYDYKARRIRISDEVAERGRLALLFHEMTEDFNIEFELGLNHKQICAISVGYHDFVVNNIDRMIDSDKGD